MSCGAPFPDREHKAGRPPKYCSNACRQRAYRQRDRAEVALPLRDRPKLSRLPSPLDRFVGRSHELTELTALVERNQVVTLTGTAGVGKTRLALELAGRFQRGGQDRVCLVELAGLHRAGSVPQAVASALGVPESPDKPLVGTLVASFADDPPVLLLDNCEHVLDSCCQLLDVLLRCCPDLRVLATSRERLRLPGEAEFGVSPLAAPDAVSLDEALSSDAVQLFVERARSHAPDVELNTEDLLLVAEICARLDGVPLAIELAARLVGVLPPAEIVHQMGNRFALLTLGARTAGQRHQSLRTAIEWGYELLDPEERAVFRRLSVLPGGFGLDTAVAVCADGEAPGSQVANIVLQLAGKSLVESAAGEGDLVRFRQLESIRAYGQDQLRAAAEWDSTHERLVNWLARLAAPLTEEVLVTAEHVRPLCDEYENIASAAEWAAGRDDRHLLLVTGLVVERADRGYVSDGRRLLAEALALAGQRPEHRAAALAQLAWMTNYQGQHGEALQLAQEAVELVQGLDAFPALLARLTATLANAWLQNGELHASASCLRECLRLVKQLDTQTSTALYLNNLGWTYLMAGRLDEAEAALTEAEPLYQLGVEPKRLANYLHTVGALALARDDVRKARRCFTDGLHAAPDEPSVTTYLIEGAAVVALREDHIDRGLRLLAAAEAIRGWLGISAESGWRERVDAAVAAAEENLTGSRFLRLHADGAMMDLAAAVDHALGSEWAALPAETDRVPSLLAANEVAVAKLVAQGFTNRQIGQRTHVSERTVETQLEQIRAKLDLRSRTHVAAWVAENGLH